MGEARDTVVGKGEAQVQGTAAFEAGRRSAPSPNLVPASIFGKITGAF